MVLVDCGGDAAATVGEIVASRVDATRSSSARRPSTIELWHRHGLPDKIQELGIPVTVIPPDPTGWSYAHGFPDEWVRTEVGPLT